MNASDLITKRIAELPDWQGKILARLRKLVLKAAPDITEEWKWDTPVFARKGLVCALGAFKDHVGMNFFKGASLEDPRRLFNGGLDAKTSRSIQLREGDAINEAALLDLIRAAVALNTGGARAPSRPKSKKGNRK
jgi:hypothetical protein